MGKLLKFPDILDILVQPITKEPLSYQKNILKGSVSGQEFPLLYGGQSPLLFPAEIMPFCKEEGVEWVKLIKSKESVRQFFGLWGARSAEWEHNSSPDDDSYKKYLEDFSDLVSDASGMILDIGCDNPENTLPYFPENIQYIGIDPLYYIPCDIFKVFAAAEFLPFSNCSFDAVCFGTSLDHCFDPNTAFSEASRVLKKDGALYLSTLVWKARAELYKDNVHFHHFREYNINGMLQEAGLTVNRFFKMPWKGNDHREGLFLKAVKE